MSGCYYSGAGNGQNTGCYELYSKDRLRPDIEVIHNAAEETVNLYGQKVLYFVNTYSPLCADNTYGEQPTSVYWGPKQLKIVIELNESSLGLSRFGFNADDEITGYFTIRGYTSAFSGEVIYDRLQQEIAPKSGDVFQMSEYGNDRPGNRAGNYYIITERRDQDVSSGQMNPLGGHYLWRIKAKRLEYSFEPGLTGEQGNDQVYDDTFAGILTSKYSDDIYDYIPTGIEDLSETLAVVSSFVNDNITLSATDFILDEGDTVTGGTY
jgi:hypothetical protein